MTVQRVPGTCLVYGHFGIAKDDAQHVIEIVSNTTRQAAYRFHLLCLLKLGFKFGLLYLRLLTLGDVAYNPSKSYRVP